MRDEPSRVTVYNPLPIAYAHREKQLRAVLGDDITFVRTSNEGLRGLARVRAVLVHLRTSRRLSRTPGPVLVTWPLLGWLEVVLWASRKSAVYLSVHDPTPLRRQIGLGPFGAWLANRVPRHRRPVIVCHSSVAVDATQRLIPGTGVIMLPLPMLPPSVRERSARRPRRVLVLGQYKPARDLDILTSIGSQLKERDIEGVIAGRGWPAIAGWAVEDRFLTEQEFDRELLGAGCVIIPYRHYFQSGVALRAVELGTPVVGAEHPFLAESLGLQSTPGIVRDPDSTEAWLTAIANAIDADEHHGPAQEIAAQWQAWLRSATDPEMAPDGLRVETAQQRPRAE